MKTLVLGEETERELFEHWYKSDVDQSERDTWFEKDSSGRYELGYIDIAWGGWKECAKSNFWKNRCSELLKIFDELSYGNDQPESTCQQKLELINN